MLTIYFVVIFAVCVQQVRPEGCKLDLFGTWPPLVLSSQTLTPILPTPFNYPDGQNTTIPIGTTVIISCNGGHFLAPYNYTKTIQATCNRDLQLEAEDKIINFNNDIQCVNFNPIEMRVTEQQCDQNAVVLELGFKVGKNIGFSSQLNVCFDLANLTTLYVNYNLSKSINYIHSTLVTDYVIDSVFNISGLDFDTIYNVSWQQQQINKMLGLPPAATQYIDPSTCYPNPGVSTPGFCFWKHHLVDRRDFIFLSQQHTMYRYSNVVPKWYFVDYNLYDLDRNIIDFAVRTYKDLAIFAGTFGVLQLPHSSTGEDVDIFLYQDGSRKAIPVPLLFWKLVYDEESFKATVFVTVNNPHLSEDEVTKYVICDDISGDISWLTWKNKNVTKGFSYACRYDDVSKVIRYLPKIFVNGVLV